MKKKNDILYCVDEKKTVFVVLLPFSVVVDTVDHNVLLDHMVRQLGIQDTSLPLI